jgi:cysteine desulfurase
MQRIFLDNNSTTRPLSEVIDATSIHSRTSFANPGSRHAEGRVARRALEDARERIAAVLGAKPGEVIFTSGGTEAVNLAILGLAAENPGTILLTPGEHSATRQACREHERRGWRSCFLEIDADGRIVDESLASLPWHEIKLATVLLAHNETGVIQDVSRLAGLCQTRGVPFHLDAVQAVGKISLDFHALNVAALSLAAHKFHGPRGIGALLLRQGTTLRPRQLGGHQEADRRAGTESVALAVGMAIALERWQVERQQWAAKLARLRDRLEEGLANRCTPVVINGSREFRLPNTLSVAFPGLDGEALLVALDLAGIACSLGSACASGSTEPAPVLLAMGRAPEIASSSVRFSIGIENTLEEIDEAINRVAQCVSRLRSLPVHTALHS